MDPGIDRAWAADVACCGVNNRGVALWKDRVVSIALDGRMFSINKATGEVAWERKIAEPAIGETSHHCAADHPRPRHCGHRRWGKGHSRLHRGDRPQHRQGGLAHLHDPTDGKIKWGYQYTPNDPYDFDEISEHPIINAKVNGEDRKLVVHAARNGFFYTLDRTNGSFIAGKQYVDQLNWTPGLDPKTGKPLNYNPNANVQIYAETSHGTRAKPKSEKLCPTNNGGKNWEPSAYNPELGLLYIPSIEGCNYIELVEEQDMVDQGGTVKPRERFTGGAVRTPDRLYGSLKAVDPTTGETKAAQKLTYPNMAGVLATAGNLIFLGHYDGTFAAYDAKTLNEVWNFNVGSPIQAPPVSYSVNGKQYVAVLVGARMWPFIVENAPALKNQTTASMLYVFSL